MKFTKITTLALAAMMAFASCSKEAGIELPELAPGDARIVIELANKTTYSTIVAEKAILNGSGKLFKADGTEIPMTGATIENNKFSATIPAAGFTNGDVAALYLYANGTPTDATAGADAKAKHAAATVATVLDRVLTLGAPAGISTSITMAPGNIVVPTTSLKRAIARVEVRNGSKWYSDNTYTIVVNAGTQGAVQMPIKGYKVVFSNLNTSGLMYGGVSVTTPKGTAEHTIDGVTAGMTNTNETLAYMYPSVDAVITVNGSDNKALKFSPAANKNYFITITPSAPSIEDADVDFDVTIGEWDADEDSGSVDFGNNSIINSNVATTPGVVGVTGSNIELASNGFGTVPTPVEFVDFFEDGIGAWTITEVKEVVTTRALDDFAPVTADKRMKFEGVGTSLKIVLMPNNTGDTKNYDLEAALSRVEGGETVTKTEKFKISQKSVALPTDADFTVKFGGQDWMQLNTQNTGVLADDEKALLAVKSTAGGTTFTEKLISYSAISTLNREYAAGQVSRYAPGNGVAALHKVPQCPEGFIIPSHKLIQTSMFGVTPAHEALGSTQNYLTLSGVTAPALNTESTIGTHKITFVKATANDMGYIKIVDAAQVEFILPWRGNIDILGNLNLARISGLATSTPSPTAGSQVRFVFGLNAAVNTGVIELTNVVKNAQNGQLVRCVKATPENFWI